jgi:phosphoglycolate phosphatase-like HAD superfamily hydrolase
MNKNIVIFDLDGTLALIEARRALAAKPDGKINWKTFFDPENIKLDLPNAPVITAFKAFAEQGFKMVILSGRDSISRAETRQWLKDNDIHPDILWMRPQGSFTPDDVLKRTWLDELGADNVFCVFDDRDKVVKMWRDNGLTCFQVAPGNF